MFDHLDRTATDGARDLARRVTRGWDAFSAEVTRRNQLAREAPQDGVRGPRAGLFVGELADFATRFGSKLDTVPEARNPGPVMLIPGFGAHPVRMRPMQRAVRKAGHNVQDWGLGFNFGPTPDNFAILMQRVQALACPSSDNLRHLAV